MSVSRWRAAVGLAVLGLAACQPRDTSLLTPEQAARFEAEGVVRRADNIRLRYTHNVGTREEGWEDRRGSIIVTKQSVLIHDNEITGLEITPRSRRFLEVQKDRDRVRIRAGSGKSREVWSFIPPQDPAGWSEDIRAVIRGSHSVAND